MRTRGFAPRAERAAPAPGRAGAILLLLLLGACASTPRRAPAPPAPDLPASPVGARLVSAAESVIGSPYLFGGSSRAGFDCSGLVVFAHAAIGLTVPRTVQEQRRAARPVRPNALAPGDLVFFRIGREAIDHVGIYAGRGRFVHAPSSGRVVSYGWMEDPYFAHRYVGAGRFWSADAAGPGEGGAGRGGP